VIRRGLPLDAWPALDRWAWNRAIEDGDMFDGRGPAAHWAQTTRNAVIAAYGRWLGFLAGSEPSALNEDPVLRLTGDRLTRYVDHLSPTTGSVGRHAYSAHLRDAVRVMCPGKVPQVLSQLVARLERECRPQSKAERIVMSSRLAALGMKLMKDAAGADGEITDCIAFRDGLMIALLAVRPIRRRTFSLIRIGRHLRRIGEEWRLVFDGPDTKSGRPFEMTIPEQLVPLLKRYLREVRPLIAGAHRHDGLWAGTKGCPLNGQAIYGAIAARTRAEFGHPIGPHLFRHCAATTVAILQPDRIRVARDLLGHASFTTTNAHYNKARSIEASRHYAGVLRQLQSTEQRPGRQRLKRAR
jgi:integrase/recombinase XerD